MIKKIILFGILGLFCIPSTAQSIVDYESYWDNFVFRTVDREDGLFRDEVYGTYQDTSGFLWIANYSFLFKYDGLSIQNHPYDIARTGVIEEFNIDKKGNLWIPGVGIGVHKISQDSVKTFTSNDGLNGNSFRTLSFTDGDSIFVGDFLNGLSILYKDSVVATYNTENGLAGDRVFRIFTDKKNRVWIGTDAGLSVFVQGKFENFTTGNGLLFNSVTDIKQMINGDIWVGSEKEGITVFKDLVPNKNYFQKGELSGSNVQWIEQNPADSSIWVAYYGAGVDRIKDGIVTNLNQEHGLVSNFSNSITFGNDGMVFIGTELGLSILTPRKIDFVDFDHVGFKEAPVEGVFQDRTGKIWVNTAGDGIRYFDNGKWSSIESPPKFTTGSGLSFQELSNGNLVVGTSASGVIIIQEDQVVKKIDPSNGLVAEEITCLEEDNEQNLWVGSFKGFNLINKETQIIDTLTKKEGLPSDLCLQMISDSKDNIWIGSLDAGVFKMNGSEVIAHYDTSDGLSNVRVFGLYEDSNETIWVLTTDYGFHKIEDGILTKYSGSPDTFVSMIEDDFGNFWFSSNGYLVRVEKEDFGKLESGELNLLRYQKFTTEDGLLPTRFAYGNSSVVTKTSSGLLLFAAKRGIVVVDPTKFSVNADSFFPYITNFQINDESIPINEINSNLKTSQKIAISFSALNLQAPEKTRFFVKLTGIDTEWVPMEDRRTVFYDYLPDGDYNFTVAAIGPDGVWSKRRANISFSIPPPFYKTWWFMTLGLLGFIAIGAGGVQIRSNMKLRALNRELETRQKIQLERERISRELHDNVGSQITNLITGIEVSNLHVKNNQQSKALSLLDNLDSDARGAMTDLRETIWLLDKDVIEFGVFIDHLNGYLNRQKRYLKELEIKVNTTVDKKCVLEPGQSMNLTRIIQEAVNNTRKYAQATEVSISFSLKNRILNVIIADNGIGMNVDENLDKGNGLKNMAYRAEEMNALFQIDSELDSGTIVHLQFEIKIP